MTAGKNFTLWPFQVNRPAKKSDHTRKRSLKLEQLEERQLLSINIAPYNVHQQSVADVYQTSELDMDRENVAVSTSSLLSRLKDRGTNTEVSPIVYGPLTTEQYRAITMGLGVQNDGIANPSLLNNGEFTSVFTVNTLLDVVDPNDGYTSLREAIISANTFAGRDLINFAEGLTGTIQLCGVEMTITSSMEIRGPGADVITIDAGGRSRIFNIIGGGSVDPIPTLAAPQIISCYSNLDGDGVNLVWIGSSGATGYAIYRKDPGKSWQFIDAVGEVSTYTDTDLTPDTTYQYYLVALSNTMGVISIPSNTATVTTNPTLWIDIAIDSLNTSRFAGPSRTDAEDQIEDDPNHFGKIIQPNYGDYDNDGVLDIWDGYTGSGQTQSAANASERFVPIVISIPDNIDLDNASFQIDYWIGSTRMTGFTEGSPPRYGDGNIRIWNKDGNEARSDTGIHQGGNFVMPWTDDMYYTAEQLGFTEEIRTITLYVEGHSVSSLLGNGEILVSMKYDHNIGTVRVEDKVKYTVKGNDFGLLIDSNNNGVIEPTIDDVIEENSPGKLIQVSKTEEIEQRVPMIFELPREGFESSNATILFGFPSHLVLFTEETGGTQLINGQLYTKDQLGQLEECGVITLYVGATQASLDLGQDIIFVATDPDGDGPEDYMFDQIVVTAFDFQYVRVYDENKIPNRSTRAVGVPENEHLYEDNPRSDYDTDTEPGIVLGGAGAQMNYANIATEVEFSPNGIGDFILWKIEGNNECIVSTSSSGSFADSKTISHVVHPSNAWRNNHPEKNDIVISVGFDKNGDGILQDDEKSVPDFQNRLIGKNEYDYCYAMLLAAGGVIIYPDASELVQIFTKINDYPMYDDARAILMQYGGTHQMANGLGFNETENLLEGYVWEYIWNSDSGFSSRILSSDSFFNKIIRPAVENLKIGEYYQNNPWVESHVFSVSIEQTHLFPAGEENNLHNSLKHGDISLQLYLYTERGSGSKPQITGISGSGVCWDFYDFRSYGEDSPNGWGCRVQVCHDLGIRNAGEVYAIHVDLNVPETHFWWDVYYDDLDYLQDKWNDIV